MKLTHRSLAIDTLSGELKLWLSAAAGRRFGLLSSLDGNQLIILLLDPGPGMAELWESPVHNNSYKSLTLRFPQLHWFERILWDLFGIVPRQHPRLKPIVVHEQYPPDFFPLRGRQFLPGDERVERAPVNYMEVHGTGVWELPVGPIHAGIIEPGHFRFSCFGETILNLELYLGYVHRGVEKRMTEVPWQKARFVAESAGTDTAAAHALAHAIAIESLFEVEIPAAAQALRTVALEIERVAMHIADIAGIMTDIGLVGMAAAMAKLRGTALNTGQLITGSRFLRSYVLPGGVASIPTAAQAAQVKVSMDELRKQLKPLLSMLQNNYAALARMEGIGTVKRSLAMEFGLVGIAARGSGVNYDTRSHFAHGLYPQEAPLIATEAGGDILARTQVRIEELWSSLDIIKKLISTGADAAVAHISLPEQLPANAQTAGIVESFRGELIHLCVTGEDGRIKRYVIKDASFNNWTAIPIAVRNNLIADFPLCNKSLSLSYSGNDL